jgi:predicted ATP-grasp superfamily ATP-dependent carboligase
VNLIKVSFGSVQNLVDAQSKSCVLSLAEALGVRCPQTRVLVNKSALEQIEHDLCFPLIVKADEGWGGLGVRLVNNALELRIAIAELSLPYRWPRRAKRLIARRIWRIFFDWWAKWPNKISVQQYIVGNPCNLAVVCWKGRVLAGITVDVLASSNEFGPATAVRIINHPGVEGAAARIISKLGLSGFLGFDFIHDQEGHAWFLEMNARATPTCYIATRGQDLAGALFDQLTGTRPKAVRQKIGQDVIVLSAKKAVGGEKLFVTSKEVDAPNAPRNRLKSLEE